MLLGSWSLVLDFRHSVVTSFFSLSLFQDFIHCEIWVRSLSHITLPKGATEATYRVQILEESATEWMANTISSTKAHLNIMKESFILYKWFRRQPAFQNDRSAAQSEWMHYIPLQNSIDFQILWKKIHLLALKELKTHATQIPVPWQTSDASLILDTITHSLT